MREVKTDHPFNKLSQPAQRALANAGITGVRDLSRFTEKEIMKLHGIGKSAIPVLKEALHKHDLYFAN
ncbi:DNA-directed RNA polymerase subunit alpha C-terminal domain-containing protein [Mucilaginibacter sp. AK015]|uniref:DNA-directed RNA polymerase subunit alpha C-terminal domain-containing protein n=1 Tax=Mucilaginibacter sp. AK015 TaxID=2723072 RepID=UPI001613C4C7|nr:DNA-directed RNA polymerase subunit alpha C-terminal domain-containing protein [Mucilaginibacter sp. AK015]MBB5395768.1 DNA-directed RNA polymerase alpha subunit [Mucilaginibacter sp. AK015]